MNTYWIKFPCNLLQYEALHLKGLTLEYGLPTKYHNKFCKIGNVHNKFENREKDVTYEQAKAIVAHIKEFGLN